MAIPFWVANISADQIQAMEDRWSTQLVQTQLANPWQQVRLDDLPLPGLWNFKKVKRKLKVQSIKKSGADGGKAIIRGLINPEFSLEGELYIPSHIDGWIEIVEGLDVAPVAGSGGNPDDRAQHSIQHPLASLSGVRNIIVLEFDYTAPEAGGPLRVTLGVLGVGERDGAAKTTSAPPPSTAPAPSIQLAPGAKAPNLIDAPKPGR